MNSNRLNLEYDPQDVTFLPHLIVGKSSDNSTPNSYIFCVFSLIKNISSQSINSVLYPFFPPHFNG